uniref:Uncharacterized protein n=1 Tax=Oryza sativa subsp. japonica TaxID=39947 RepID=Q651X2_ORYSJ|nr:hypothetical protein [Oryza sativa Japonica Group]
MAVAGCGEGRSSQMGCLLPAPPARGCSAVHSPSSLSLSLSLTPWQWQWQKAKLELLHASGGLGGSICVGLQGSGCKLQSAKGQGCVEKRMEEERTGGE